MKQNILTEDGIASIEKVIAEIEKQTSGEIRVIIAQSSPWWKYGWKKPVESKAIKLFKRYGMDQTIDKTGVLLFLSLKERRFYIYADTGIYQKIGPEQLNSISDKLSESFKIGNFKEGIIGLLEKIAEPLILHFPLKPGDINEIDNGVIFIK